MNSEYQVKLNGETVTVIEGIKVSTYRLDGGEWKLEKVKLAGEIVYERRG